MATFDLFVLSIFVFFGYLMFGMATAKMLSEEGTIFCPRDRYTRQQRFGIGVLWPLFLVVIFGHYIFYGLSWLAVGVWSGFRILIDKETWYG